MVTNDFNLDLKYSLESRDTEGLNKFYFSVFPELKEIENVTDLTMQLQGIDKILHFNNGKKILIDEKKRREDYGDIALEEWSDYDNRKVGWLNKKKHTDYIVYVIMPTMTIYLFPFWLLQLAWRKNYKLWCERFGRKFSQNPGYRTSFIPIPPEIIYEALNKEMRLL